MMTSTEILSNNSGGWRSVTRVPAGSGSWLADSSKSYKGTNLTGARPHPPTGHHLTLPSSKGPISTYTHWGSGLQHTDLEQGE